MRSLFERSCSFTSSRVPCTQLHRVSDIADLKGTTHLLIICNFKGFGLILSHAKADNGYSEFQTKQKYFGTLPLTYVGTSANFNNSIKT